MLTIFVTNRNGWQTESITTDISLNVYALFSFIIKLSPLQRITIIQLEKLEEGKATKSSILTHDPNIDALGKYEKALFVKSFSDKNEGIMLNYVIFHNEFYYNCL